MTILIVASYNKQRFAPFIVEQAECLAQNGCTIEWFGIQRKGLFGYLRELFRLRKKTRRLQPDIIHAHYGLSCLLANLATRRVPVVSTYHGSDINMPSIRPLSKIALRLSAWNIFVSRKTMELVGTKEGDRCSLIPCGVTLSDDQLQTREEARKTLGWKTNDKRVLFAGAFDNPVKAPEIAQSVIEDLSHTFAGLSLVELKGYSRQEVNRLLCAADALLLTSQMEGSPSIIKEALACGCPFASVDVGDVAERIQDVNGCYLAASRQPTDIARALEQALAYIGKTNGRERIIADKLDSSSISRRIKAVYTAILAEK